MYENLVGQEAGRALIADIKNNRFPRAVLFAGAEASGKLTAALETARVLSCTGSPKGAWQCECVQCRQAKALSSPNIMLLGARDCSLEISAAQKAFINSAYSHAPYLTATRYLYLRSVRKLTLRFNPILWQGDSDLNKIGSVMDEINEELEKLDFSRELPSLEDLQKITETISKLTSKLENDFFYDSVPISQVRNMEEWAHIKSDEGKKTIIIENADRMLPGVRNALLKILEEPPADCIFILLTSKRSSMMQTILSRVRTYNFKERTLEHQGEVIQRVFHDTSFTGTINDYMLTFLPIPPGALKKKADDFCNSFSVHHIPDCSAIAKECENFNPRIELRLFLHYIAMHYKNLLQVPAGAEAGSKLMELLRRCHENVTMYNQTPAAALEILFRDMSVLNTQNGGVLR